MTAATIAPVKHFLRCAGCLAGVYVETPNRYPNQLSAAKCDACGWSMRYEGILNNGRITYDVTAPACDAQCTSALGVVCICRCGGENHGSKRTVTFTVDAGEARVATPGTVDAVRIAQEYGVARKALRATVAELVEKRNARVWLGAGDFAKVLDVERRLNKAGELKTHAGRMKVLAVAS